MDGMRIEGPVSGDVANAHARFEEVLDTYFDLAAEGLNRLAYMGVDEWRTAPIEGSHPYVYLDGMTLKRTWAGEVRDVHLLIAIGVNADGFRNILGICEGSKNDRSGWNAFLEHLRGRGLKGVELVVSDACTGLVESLADYYPEAASQRCIVQWRSGIVGHARPDSVRAAKGRDVSAMLKVIHAQRDVEAARSVAREVVSELQDMGMGAAARMVADTVEETFTHFRFPKEHWRRIRTNESLGRLVREIRRMRVFGAFPDGSAYLTMAAARLRSVAGSAWSAKRFLAMPGVGGAG